MKTYEYQIALRDAPLRANAKLVAFMLSTYGETSWPSLATLAASCGLNPKTVRSALKLLVKEGWVSATAHPGRATTYTLTPPKTDPSQTSTPPKRNQGSTLVPHPSQTRGVHPSQTSTPETIRETIKETDRQTDIATAPSKTTDSHAGLVELDDSDLVEVKTAVTPPPIPKAPSSWMDKWADAWGQVCGHIPLPPIAQIEALHCDELRFAAALARVASMKHGGQLRSARKAFFGTLRKLAEKEDHEISAWTPAGVLQELEGERVKTSTVPYHRPAPPPTPELTEEEREATRAAMRQWVMTPSGDLLHIDSPEYKRYQEALERRGVAA